MKIQYGETAIDYELLTVNRKSLEIAVHPDKSVVVKAPLSASQAAVEERLRKRARWIKRQIAYFMQLTRVRRPEDTSVARATSIWGVNTG